MHFTTPLITLLSLVAVSAQRDVCHLATDRFCTCGHKFHSVVAFTDPEFKRTFCGGTLINHRQVLTLAQCVAGRNQKDFKVVVKLYNGAPETLYDVESIEFHIVNNQAARDVAIVNIVEQLNEKDSEGIVCLPFCYPTQLFDGLAFRTLGWYRHSDEKRESVTSERIGLNVVDGCVYDNEYLRNKTMCISETVIDKYDGGEPVFWEINDKAQMQFGIILPRTSRDGDKLTTVLRIGPFGEWIESRARGYRYCKYL